MVLVLLGSLISVSAGWLMTASAASAAQQGRRQYVGAMGTATRIRMTLDIRGTTVQGSYVYEAIGKPLALAGTLSDKQLTLREADENGNHTGTFRGQFVTTTLIEGTWSNPAGSKKLPFSVKAVADSSATATSSSASAASAASSADPISGEYQRLDERGRIQRVSGATLNIERRGDGSVRVQGQAFLVVNAQTGNVRTGEVEGVFALSGNRVRIKGEDEYACAMTLTFGKGTLEVSDDNGQCGGLAVSFDGTYKRVGAAKFD